MLLIKIKNQALLKWPWFFTVCTLIGGTYPLYLAGPSGRTPPVIAVIVLVVGLINLWFYLSLRKTLRDKP